MSTLCSTSQRQYAASSGEETDEVRVFILRGCGNVFRAKRGYGRPGSCAPVNLVADILNNIENLYHYSNQREVAKIQDEFWLQKRRAGRGAVPQGWIFWRKVPGSGAYIREIEEMQ